MMTREEIKAYVDDGFTFLAISDAYSLIDKIYNDFEQQLKIAQDLRNNSVLISQEDVDFLQLQNQQYADTVSELESTIEAQEIMLADMRKRIEELETQRFELWMLLDNIDTAEDIAKSDDKLFRGLCRNEYKNRWSVYEPKEEQ